MYLLTLSGSDIKRQRNRVFFIFPTGFFITWPPISRTKECVWFDISTNRNPSILCTPDEKVVQGLKGLHTHWIQRKGQLTTNILVIDKFVKFEVLKSTSIFRFVYTGSGIHCLCDFVYKTFWLQSNVSLQHNNSAHILLIIINLSVTFILYTTFSEVALYVLYKEGHMSLLSNSIYLKFNAVQSWWEGCRQSECNQPQK